MFASKSDKILWQCQVLDLCLWQREFSSGLGGTGRDVGVGGVRIGEAPLRRQQAATSPRFKEAGAAALPPPPVGCRYLRVLRPVDRHNKVTFVRIDHFCIRIAHRQDWHPLAQLSMLSWF